MNSPLDPEMLKIPAYMRKKAIVSQARQKLILTALDRKEAHLPPTSKTALAPVKTPVKRYVPKREISQTPARLSASTPDYSFQPPLLDMPVPSKSARTIEPKKMSSVRPFARIGRVTNYLDKINVAIILLEAALNQNEQILVESEKSLFVQNADEMQINRQPVKKARKGDHIGLKVRLPAIVNGGIYRFGQKFN
jgi:hypothetical protein